MSGEGGEEASASAGRPTTDPLRGGGGQHQPDLRNNQNRWICDEKPAALDVKMQPVCAGEGLR